MSQPTYSTQGLTLPAMAGVSAAAAAALASPSVRAKVKSNPLLAAAAGLGLLGAAGAVGSSIRREPSGNFGLRTYADVASDMYLDGREFPFDAVKREVPEIAEELLKANVPGAIEEVGDVMANFGLWAKSNKGLNLPVVGPANYSADKYINRIKVWERVADAYGIPFDAGSLSGGSNWERPNKRKAILDYIAPVGAVATLDPSKLPTEVSDLPWPDTIGNAKTSNAIFAAVSPVGYINDSPNLRKMRRAEMTKISSAVRRRIEADLFSEYSKMSGFFGPSANEIAIATAEAARKTVEKNRLKYRYLPALAGTAGLAAAYHLKEKAPAKLQVTSTGADPTFWDQLGEWW